MEILTFIDLSTKTQVPGIHPFSASHFLCYDITSTPLWYLWKWPTGVLKDTILKHWKVSSCISCKLQKKKTNWNRFVFKSMLYSTSKIIFYLSLILGSLICFEQKYWIHNFLSGEISTELFWINKYTYLSISTPKLTLHVSLYRYSYFSVSWS